jgi:hypothetical protein
MLYDFFVLAVIIKLISRTGRRDWRGRNKRGMDWKG